MPISKLSLILLILNIVICPLLGNTNLINISSLEVINKFLLFLLPALYFISFIYDLYKNKFKGLKFDILTILLILSLFSLIISACFGINYNFNVFTNLMCYIYLLSFIYTIHIYKFTSDDYSKIIKSIITIFAIISIIGIIQYIFNLNLIERGIQKYPGAKGRITSTMSNATILDKYLTFNILIVIYTMFKSKKFNWKLIIPFLLGIIALSLTYSRSGTICFYFIAIVFLILFLFKKQFINLLVIIMSLIVLYLIPGQKYLLSSTVNYVNNTIIEVYEKLNIEFLSPINDTIANIFIIKDYSEENDDSINSRNYYMSIAKRIIEEHPLTGIGIGNYNYIYKNQNVNNYLNNKIDLKLEYLYPHNLYYHYCAETGIISLILLFSILICILIKTKKRKNLIIGTLFFIIFCLFNTTESLFYMKDIAFWIIITYSLLMKKSYASTL